MKKILCLFLIICNNVIYCQTFDGNLGSQSLRWSTEQKDFNSPPRVGVHPMSIKLWDNYESANAPSTWGSLLEISGKSEHLVSQLYFDNTWNGSRILYRSAFYGQNTWENWRYLLDSKNNVESSGNLLISGTGNSGIGTNTPEKKLQINASNSDAGLRLHAAVGDNNTSTPYLLLTGGYQTNNGVALRGIGDQGYGKKALVFYSGWEGNIDNPTIANLQERMRVSSNGNVGIGTTNPTSKLTVAGNINSREVKVTVDAGADFVFESDYKLPSLDLVEKYIQENKHLPEIASADEMKKDGINLSEMNIKLLQKIEELTLHLIEKDKQINFLLNENAMTKKDFNEIRRLVLDRIKTLEKN